MATDPEMVAGLLQSSFELNGTFDPSRPFSYVAPHRRSWWRRWEIVEYTGQVIPDEVPPEVADFWPTAVTVSFNMVGPLTKTVHPRRFWLLWSVNRYLRRLKAERP